MYSRRDTPFLMLADFDCRGQHHRSEVSAKNVELASNGWERRLSDSVNVEFIRLRSACSASADHGPADESAAHDFGQCVAASAMRHDRFFNASAIVPCVFYL